MNWIHGVSTLDNMCPIAMKCCDEYGQTIHCFRVTTLLVGEEIMIEANVVGACPNSRQEFTSINSGVLQFPCKVDRHEHMALVGTRFCVTTLSFETRLRWEYLDIYYYNELLTRFNEGKTPCLGPICCNLLTEVEKIFIKTIFMVPKVLSKSWSLRNIDAMIF